MPLLLDRPARQTAPPDQPSTPRRRALGVTLLLVAAMAGGAAGAGVLAGTGALGGGDVTTTVLQRDDADVSSAAAPAIDAARVYARTAAGVVDITARGTTTSQGPTGGPFVPPEATQATATGSGFVVDDDGRIVTAAHVVDDAASIAVTFQDGTSRSAKLLGSDDATDVALLEVDPGGLTLKPLTLGSSAALDIGDAVAAIGDPFDFDRSISTGIVSGLDRTIEAPNGFTVAHAIQTDAALNPGNSGGPLLDSRGRVVGIVDQIATDGSAEQSSGVGFAVPIDLVADELPALSRGETVEHAYLGVSTATTTGATAGALVASVSAGSPAAVAGLRPGDVVTAFDGTRVRGTSDLVAAIADHAPGDRVTVTVRRGTSTTRLTAELAAQPEQRSTPE